jgi:hypothetical protein
VQRDLKIRGYVVAQSPNPPLWAALGALVVALLTPGGAVHDVARAAAYVAFAIWAYEEAARGVNGFRRALGLGGLLLIVAAVAGTI